jgi:hypothetical protein
MINTKGSWYNGDEDVTNSPTESTSKETARSKKDERYDNVVALMHTFFECAEQGAYTPLDPETHSLLNKIFASNDWGFREILLLVVIARLLHPDYKASVDFYGCNPRPLFEEPIRSMFA